MRHIVAPVVKLTRTRLCRTVAPLSSSKRLHPFDFVECLGRAPRNSNPSPTAETWFWQLHIKISRVRLRLPRRCCRLSLLCRADVFGCFVGCVLLLSLGRTSKEKRPTNGYVVETLNHLSRGRCFGIRQRRGYLH